MSPQVIKAGNNVFLLFSVAPKCNLCKHANNIIIEVLLFQLLSCNKRSVFTTTLKHQRSGMAPQPHLHVTSGDEALVLDVTHLEELVGFLPDSVLSHVLILTLARLFAAPLLLPCSSGRGGGGGGIGGGTRSSKRCHGICESVDTRAFPASFTLAQTEVWRKEILEKSSFRLLYIRGSHQCHRLSSLSNHLFNKSMKPRRETGGESSV